MLFIWYLWTVKYYWVPISLIVIKVWAVLCPPVKAFILLWDTTPTCLVWFLCCQRPTAAVLCPWARHFTPRKYWLITQEAMAPSRYDWKIVDWDVKPQHNQPNLCCQVLDKLVCFLAVILSEACFYFLALTLYPNLFCHLHLCPDLSFNLSIVFGFFWLASLFRQVSSLVT